MGRLSTTLAVSAGALAAIYVAACVLPNGPSDAGRIQFTLDFPVPYRVPLAGVAEPLITISADGQVLKNPAYRLETLNAAVVRVDSTGRGLVGVVRGTASVRVVYQTATGAPDTVFAVQVVVARVAVESPTLSFTRLGDTTRLTATAFDAHGAAVPNVAFTWSSSDSLLAWVDAGLVTALDEGSVAIAAEADSVRGVASVAVTQVAAGVEVAPRVDTLHTVGRTVQFSAIAFDSTSSILPFAKAHWTSSDPAVARVDATGLVTVDSGGTARIIARVGVAADTATLVVKQVVRFLLVTPSLDTLTAIADTSRIVALARDSLHFPIPHPAVTWATNDPTIATVDPTGRVTAAANGVVLVTVSSDGQSAFATVLVRQEAVAARLSQHSVALTGQGDTVRLGAVGLDRNGYLVAGTAFAWRSSSGCVATVDAAGLLTARGEGETGIVATLANGGPSDTAAVTVTGAPSWCAQALIAFESPQGIEVMGADGSGRTVLIGGALRQPAWSPDGARLAFSRTSADGMSAIYTVRADGSDELSVTDGTHYDVSPAWSPDGTKIAFGREVAGCLVSHLIRQIYVMNADGSGLMQLPWIALGHATWSPDGTKIAFALPRHLESCEPPFLIAVGSADGTGDLHVVGSVGSYHPAWSPDGSQLAFGYGGDIWLMNPDGTGARNLTLNGYAQLDETPAWSPDGAHIVFASAPQSSSPVWDLYVINRDGTGLQQLTFTPDVSESNPAWRPVPPPASQALTGTRRGPKR